MSGFVFVSDRGDSARLFHCIGFNHFVQACHCVCSIYCQTVVSVRLKPLCKTAYIIPKCVAALRCLYVRLYPLYKAVDVYHTTSLPGCVSDSVLIIVSSNVNVSISYFCITLCQYVKTCHCQFLSTVSGCVFSACHRLTVSVF